MFSDLALSAPAQDNFIRLVNKKKFLYNRIFEYYNSRVGVKPWVAFDMGITRSVKFKSNIDILYMKGGGTGR
jgi:hypothetical protein